MSQNEPTDFSKKHGPDVKIDPEIKAEILRRSKNEKVPCAVAFNIADALHTTPGDVGIAIDLMNYRLAKCQLGLFGYEPEKKIVTPLDPVTTEMKDLIEAGLKNGRLPCKAAWDIARKLNIGKMKISQACETLEIKIKPCQLGAF